MGKLTTQFCRRLCLGIAAAASRLRRPRKLRRGPPKDHLSIKQSEIYLGVAQSIHVCLQINFVT